MSDNNIEKTVENVKARLLEEGREARNLVAFSVPLQQRRNLHSNNDSRIKSASKDLKRLSVEAIPANKPEKRQRSASAGRDPQAKSGRNIIKLHGTETNHIWPIGLKARHWGFLFRNLQQAVDEIYQTCEDDDSVIECKEAILILERYTNDFYKLIEWLKLKWAYENTPPPQRPNSLSWEIRTSSPSKRAQSRRKNFSLYEARKAKSAENDQLTTKNVEIHNASTEAQSQKIDKTSDLEPVVEVTEIDMKSTPEPDEQAQKIPKSPSTSRKKSQPVKSKALSMSASETHIHDISVIPGNRFRSKSATNLKGPIKPEDTKKNERNAMVKAVPTVNMNKASQVRRAYNQSKTPMRQLTTQKNNDQRVTSKLAACKSALRKSIDLHPNQRKTEQHKKMKEDKCQLLVRSATTLSDSRVKHASFKNRTVSMIVKDSKQSCEDHSSTCSLASTSSSGQSWADKVRGVPKSQSETHSQVSLIGKDEEGWEIVRRGRRSGSSASLSSPISKSLKGSSFHIQNRFNQPTSAVSMPSLAVNKKKDETEEKTLKSTPKKKKKEEDKKYKKKVNNSAQECQKSKKITSNEDGQMPKIHELDDEKKQKDLTNCKKQEELMTPKEPFVPALKVDEGGTESDREEEEMTKNEAAWKTAVEEEQRLKKQIEEEEMNPIEVLVEDDTEVSSEGASTLPSDDLHKDENLGECRPVPLSWADQMDMMDADHEVARSPGRVLYIHEKLSSPSRKLTISEKEQKHLNRLAKAQELRGRLIHNKTEKLKDLFKKIDEVHSEKDRLLHEKRDIFERKMARAEETRNRHLQKIVTKAHDEDNKAKEIAFINGLEAQNKLHDIMQQHQSLESRLADMAEERCRKQEEKAAKEVAAQERRKAIEAERQARMAELCEKRRQRCERIDRQQAERREELLEQAREKARDREERLSALQQAQQAKECELVKKIQQKQEETARRHEENIELIRQRAFEFSVSRCLNGCDDAPKLSKYETKKLCTLCNALIASEVYLLSHLRGKQHQEALKESCKEEMSDEQATSYNLKHIIDAPDNIDDPQVTRDRERQKALKKRCRKIRSRMVSKGKEFLKDFKFPQAGGSSKGRMAKALQQISKLISMQGTGPWVTADVALLDRNLLELQRIVKGPSDQTTFLALGGFQKLGDLLSLIVNSDICVIPGKSLGFCVQVLIASCDHCYRNCQFVLESNLAGNIVDQLARRLSDLSNDILKENSNANSLVTDPAVNGLMEFLARFLTVLMETENIGTGWPKIQDVVSYCVSVGVLDKITWYFNRVQCPVDNDQPSTEFILSAMNLLSSLTKTLIGRPTDQDPTQLVGTIQVTEAYGVISLLYGILLHQAGRSVSPPPSDHLSFSTLSITEASTTLLYNIAELDLKVFQGIMGSEGISLELRHICSFLLWYCSHWPQDTILHNIITLVGFFTVGNKENQGVVQSGEIPSVLQQLCSLPWKYFSDAKLSAILFPTLVASCMDNQDNMLILEQEMSSQVLVDFMNKKEALSKTLVKIVQKSWSQNPYLIKT